MEWRVAPDDRRDYQMGSRVGELMEARLVGLGV